MLPSLCGFADDRFVELGFRCAPPQATCCRRSAAETSEYRLTKRMLFKLSSLANGLRFLARFRDANGGGQ